MSAIFELKSRFKGCPPICLATNLPSFKDRAEALMFHVEHAPGTSIYRMGKCETCGQIHYKAKMRPPSGSSSGTGRDL